MNALSILLPETVLGLGAAVCFLLGIGKSAGTRLLAPWVAMITLVIAALVVLGQNAPGGVPHVSDATAVVAYSALSAYVKLATAILGALFVLLAWPSLRNGTGNRSVDYGAEAGEFFGLILLSLSGLMLVASAEDLILLFMGIELAAIPTYILVSMSKPLPTAQEAGLKYFFLGAMAAAILLLGMSYLYGSTGSVELSTMAATFASTGTLLPKVALLGAGITVLALCFKFAAFPMHFYAGDVYTGAATPVTALIGFVPKASGTIAMIKIIMVVSGGAWYSDPKLVLLLGIIAALTMTLGNTLALMQYNLKRMLAYSSVAHSGYILVGLTALAASNSAEVQQAAIKGVLFYLVGYGLMNTLAFAVMQLVPTRQLFDPIGPERDVPPPATTAETLEDIAGLGRRDAGLGVAMTVAMLSLIGLPLTVGFFGKLLIVGPAFNSGQGVLATILLINAAIAAAYYLKIVATVWLRAEPYDQPAAGAHPGRPLASRVAVWTCTGGVLLFGLIPPAINGLLGASDRAAASAALIDTVPVVPVAPQPDLHARH